MPKAQMEIPGTERPKIKAIEDAALEYVTLKERREKLAESEGTAKLQLIMAMQKHQDKLDTTPEGDYCYRCEDQIIILSEKEVIKVKEQKDQESED